MNHDMALWNVTLHPQAEPELKAPPRGMQALLKSGGDFADGVIAFEGELLGGQEFVSFDPQAVNLLKAHKGQVNVVGPSLLPTDGCRYGLKKLRNNAT